MPGGPERLLHTDQQHLRLLFPDYDRRRHRPDVHRFGNQGRPARHIPREAAQRPEDMDPVLQGRHVLQLDHRRHRTFAPERHQGVFGSRQAAAAGRRRGHPLVLLLAADLHLRRRALLHQGGRRPTGDAGDRPHGPHVGEGDPRLPDRRIAALRALDGPGAFVGGRGQPHGRRDGLDDDCQARAVEPPLGRRPRGARRTGENLRRPATVSARRHHVPQQEHPGVDLRGAAHLHARRTVRHDQRGSHHHSVPQRQGHLRRRGDSRNGHGHDHLDLHAPQQLFLRRSPDQKKATTSAKR